MYLKEKYDVNDPNLKFGLGVIRGLAKRYLIVYISHRRINDWLIMYYFAELVIFHPNRCIYIIFTLIKYK